jgi:hypothetical protein
MHTVQSTIHTEYKYKSIIVLNAKGKEMRNKCCGLLLEIRKSLDQERNVRIKSERRGCSAYQISICEHLTWGGNQTLLDILFLLSL